MTILVKAFGLGFDSPRVHNSKTGELLWKHTA